MAYSKHDAGVKLVKWKSIYVVFASAADFPLLSTQLPFILSNLMDANMVRRSVIKGVVSTKLMGL